jgi:hypothetical protein
MASSAAAAGRPPRNFVALQETLWHDSSGTASVNPLRCVLPRYTLPAATLHALCESARVDSSPLLASAVDWTGDNPGIYLKDGPDAPFRTLTVWFRIAHSRHGAGHALVLFEDPTRSAGWPEVANYCITDHPELARDLVARFCTRFGVFRGAAAFSALEYLPMTAHSVTGDGLASSVLTVHAEGIETVLRWDALGTPFAADVPPAQSATGEHRMLSVFIESADASITVNGRRLPGKAYPRPFFGRSVSSAFLASSETWLHA